MFFFLPYNVDVPMARWPYANWALMLLTVLVSLIAFPAMMGGAQIERWMMSGAGDWWSDAGLLGSTLTHAGPVHLIGNMIFLFVFGNAVNAKLGHALFISCYFLLGVVSAAAFALFSGESAPSLGASGAIAGITGMFIVLYPKNNVSVFFMFWVFFKPFVKTYQISGWIVIGFYFAKDLLFQILLATTGYEAGTAFMAHLAGTAAGVVLASLLLLTDRIRPTKHEITMLDLLGVQKH